MIRKLAHINDRRDGTGSALPAGSIPLRRPLARGRLLRSLFARARLGVSGAVCSVVPMNEDGSGVGDPAGTSADHISPR